MRADDLDPISCALFLLCAFTVAGVVQTLWFRSPASRRFMRPLDGGLMLGGRRLFGANKTLRGFVGMVPAASAAFGALAMLAGAPSPGHAGLWTLSTLEYAAVGAVAGFGFMAGELPNSFVKRRLGIPEGQSAVGAAQAIVQFAGDRLDSGIGMLAATTAVVPVPLTTWIVVLAAGPAIHWMFSVAMYRLGVKARAA